MSNLILGVLFLSTGAFTPPSARLAAADSLFSLHAYTQAYDHYAQLYKDQYVSSRMLLRMAYIQEALQNYPMALYYLLDYYTLRPHSPVLNKVASMAKTHGLFGYEMNLTTRAAYLLHYYRFWVIGVLVLVFAWNWITHWRQRSALSRLLMAVSAGLSLLIGHSALWMPQHALQYKPNAIAIHKDPSGVSPTIGVIPSGTRIAIQHKKSIWTQIQFQNTKGYVRTHHLKAWPIH